MARSPKILRIRAASAPTPLPVLLSLLLLAPIGALAQEGGPAAGDGPGDDTGAVEVVVRPGEGPEAVVGRALAGVTSVELAGEVPEGGGLARLSLTIGLYARGPGPHRVPIGLDGLYPREAVADGRPLGWEAVPPDGWFVILPGEGPGGEGQRTVRVDVVAPVRSADDRQVLALRIPRHPNTRLRLDLPGPVAEATLGDGSLLAVAPIDDGRRSRIEAELGALDELAVRWLPRRPEGAPLPPLLAGLGHIAVDVGGGALTAESTWEIRVGRGEATAIELLADPADQLLGVEVDGRSVAPEPAEDGIGLRLPLPRTLRKGDSARVAVATRRPVPPPGGGEGLSTVTFSGHRFGGLVSQGGTLSVSRPDGVRALADATAGLWQIDPRDLGDEVARVRPTTVSAYRFGDQPFGLSLRVGPTPAVVRVAQRTLAALEPGGGGVRVESWLDYRPVRGQLFSARVAVPEGLEVDRVGPPEAVSSWELLGPDGGPGGHDTDDGDPGAAAGPRTILLTLAAPAREGQATPTRVELSGRARLDPDPKRPRPIPLFRPLDAGFDGGRLAVSAPPDLDASAPGAGDGAPAPGAFETAPETDPGPWSRPDAGPNRLALWLRHEAPLDAATIGLAPRAPSASSLVDQLVRVGRDGVDVQQDITLFARDGELGTVDLAIPVGLERGWELLDRGAVAEEEPIPSGPDGRAVRRMKLSRPSGGGPLKLRASFRLPGADRLEPGAPRALTIPRIEVLDPKPAAPPRVEIAAEPGVALEPEGPGWQEPAQNQWVTDPDGGAPLPIRHVWVRPPGAEPGALPTLSATAPTPAELPALLASRLWIRSEQGPDGGVRTSAWFRLDDHGPTLGFRLPAAAALDRVYLDGRPVPPEDVDDAGRLGAFRVHLPADAARGLLVGLSYRVGPGAARDAWTPPEPIDGRVLETLWEVRVPWSRALVGVPAGVSDENLWYWGGYVWKRRPGMDAAALAAWVAGPGATVDALGPPLTAGRVGDHGYLFGRPGGPGPLGPTIASRATLVGACSGAVLLVGLLALVRRPWGRRSFAGALALLVGLLALVGRDAAALALQSSSVGWLLVAVAVLTRRAVDRRRPAAPYGEPSGLGTASGLGDGPPTGGSAGSSPAVGSDDSTAIRPRPAALGGPPNRPAAPSTVSPSPHPDGAGPGPGPDRREAVFEIPAPRADRGLS